jgi:HAD superfamily hydrolase (TIGR01549 family)
MIKAILFDLWGTLIYNKSEKDPHKELIKLFKSHGIDNPDDFYDRSIAVRKFKNIEEAAEHVYRKTGIERKRLETIIKKYYDVEVAPFPDVVSNLERLKKGYKLAIVSNINHGLEAFKRSGLESFFDYKFYSFEVGMIKQDPEFFRYVLKKIGMKPDKVIMVGDCMFGDIDPAERAGIRSILIKRAGYLHHYKEKETFKRTIKTLDELNKYIRLSGPS